MGKKFKHLTVPSHWKHYWTRHPEGYTILEALLNWVGQVDRMVDQLNDWDDFLEEFTRQYDEDVQAKVHELLTQWKEDGTLDHILNQAILANQNKLFSKRIYKQYPIVFPHYGNIVNTYNHDYIYPQSFTIDWEAKEIFIVYEPSMGGDTKRWVVVWGLDGEYKTAFHAGNSGGEGIVVKYEGGSRYMYVKTDQGRLGKFLINQLPAPMTSATPVTEYDVNLAFEFTYRNGTWLIEQAKPNYGTYQRRTAFHVYNDNFDLIGTMDIDNEFGGYFSSTYSDYIPKRQGIALGDNVIYQAIGGNYRIDHPTVTPGVYQGLVVLNRSGENIAEAFMHPQLFIDKLAREENVYSERIENEGIHVAPDGRVYTLYVHLLDLKANLAQLNGIIIFEEMSSHKDAVDYSDTARIFPRVNPHYLQSGAFPSSDGKMYDPYRGIVMDDFEKILTLMEGIELGEFNFFSNVVPGVKDINGNEIPPNTYVTIRNANNYTYHVRLAGTTTTNEFIIYGNPNNRTQVEVKTQTRQLTEHGGSCVYKYGVDLNTITETGWYYIDSGAPNNPNKTYGFLEVIGSALTAVQFFHPITNDNVYKRRLTTDGWTEWKLLTIG